MADHIAQRLEMLKQVAEANRDPLNLAINALVQATPGTLRQVIAQHPVLLDDKTLVAFDDFATQCEKEGDTTLATRLRLRLAEVRRISKEGEQVLQQHSPFRDEPVAEELYNPPRTYAEDHSISIGTHSGSGPVVQYNIDELTLPPKKWQHPGTPSNPKTFVGRKEELAQFSQYLIAGESVTISGTPATVMLQGMGGIGKTYLATQLAIEVQPYFPAGVILLKFGERILCEQDAQPLLHYLAGYAFEGHTFQIIGQLQLQPQLVKAWLEETAPGRLLVIFDDIWDSEPLRLLEQAIPANAVRIVTTRDANIAQALDGRRKELDRLTMEDGIALLEVRLGCQGNTMYHDALKKLVETLGRHAQALDVIAARIKKPQRIEAILRELEQGVGRARLNQIKLRESQIRVENLEKSLGLSYEYMTPEEKRSFRKLGVFEEEAPITLEAAQAIWGMDNASEARNLLCDLVDLSMLEETGDSYRQHSLLQTYAYALMEDEGELNGTRWAHAEYYRELAWRAETATPKDYPLLDRHMQNLQSALEWSKEHEPLLFSQLVEVLFQFLQLRGQSKKLEQYLPIAKDIAERTGHPGRQANLLQSLGDLERRLGKIDEARAHYDAALPLYRSERARLGEANIYRRVAEIFVSQRDLADARIYFEQALQLYIAERTPLGQANTLLGLGVVHFESGDLEQGKQAIQQAIELYLFMQDSESAHRAELLLAQMQDRQALPEIDMTLLNAFVNVQSSQEMFQLVQQHPEMLTDTWIEATETLAEAQEDDELKGAIGERLNSLRQIRQVLEQNAVAESSKAADLVIEFTRGDWSERRQMLSQHADTLLNDSIESVISLLIQANEGTDVRQILEDVRTLLRRCRTWGVDAVFYFELHMRLGDSIDIPVAYEDTIMQVATLRCRQDDRVAAWAEATVLLETLLARLTADVPPLFEATLLRDLAETMAALPANHPAHTLATIEMYYHEALALYESEARPVSVANIQRSIGDILSETGRYEESLTFLQPAAQSLQAQEGRQEDAAWALSAYASALDQLGSVEEAIASYTRAMALLPDSSALLRNRSESLIHAGQLTAAEADLARAVALDGNEDSSYLWFHRAQLALARRDGSQADQMLDEVLKRAPARDVTLQRAESAWIQGDLETTVATLRTAFDTANPGQQAAMRRELQRMLIQYPDLPTLPPEFLPDPSQES